MSELSKLGRAPLRVLAVIDTVQISGPGKQLVASIPVLKQGGVDVEVVVFHREGRPISPFAELLKSDGIPHTILPESRPFDTALLRRFTDLLRNRSPDLVQTHGYKPTACMFVHRAMGSTIPWVAFFHGSTSENVKVRMYHMLDSLLMRRADHTVVMSQHHRTSTRFRNTNTSVIYNAVLKPAYGDRFSLRTMRSQTQPVRLAAVGRLSPEKGMDVLLHACHLLHREGFRFETTIAGDGPERGALTRLCTELDLSAHVSFVGHCDNTDDIYKSTNALVIPSRSEGLPNVLLEAMRFGTPVIATTVGAIPEVLSDSSAGMLCPPDDPVTLAAAIRKGSTVEYAIDGLHAREQILKQFSLERRCLALRNLYETLTSRSHISQDSNAH